MEAFVYLFFSMQFLKDLQLEDLSMYLSPEDTTDTTIETADDILDLFMDQVAWTVCSWRQKLHQDCPSTSSWKEKTIWDKCASVLSLGICHQGGGSGVSKMVLCCAGVVVCAVRLRSVLIQEICAGTRRVFCLPALLVDLQRQLWNTVQQQCWGLICANRFKSWNTLVTKQRIQIIIILWSYWAICGINLSIFLFVFWVFFFFPTYWDIIWYGSVQKRFPKPFAPTHYSETTHRHGNLVKC